jgi:dCTP deaminase
VILTGREIARQVRNGRVILDPYDASQVNPNSYDLTLDSRLLVYRSALVDTQWDNPVDELRIPPEGMVLEAGGFYLGASREVVGSRHYVPQLHAKSGVARLGLFVHVTANLIDVGSVGNLTLQLHPILSLRVYPGIRIAQVSFWRTEGEITLYNGKYQGSVGPQSSRSYVDSTTGLT